jgi:hypothetical protein
MSDCLPRPRREGRGSSGAPGLVRLLLRWTFPAMFTVLSACVLPIGPDFQDPPAVPNYEPYFQGVFPDAETTHQLLPPDKFDIVLGDPNPTDRLSVRWIANYPPSS